MTRENIIILSLRSKRKIPMRVILSPFSFVILSVTKYLVFSFYTFLVMTKA
ncbi:hypothetical protein [Helicobacter bilis]|uniref:hypothetical protein n=1 Tax=Helicobacter bilis TaxID=37372 RepID=UPI0013155E35|nr:hypothetical protein [Helicobacter bilis]MCI7410825.1 hypothetical protein [Helicobacter bilis]MDD7295856.1 hypothetical protein [Helicobacter bilis]MDY4400809.1 hypothetical protein [Helicobacter bilis]